MAMITGLEPFEPSTDQPWDERRVQHLYQRIGFGASLAQVREGLQLSPSDLVDQLIDNLLSLSPPEPPDWATWQWSNYGNDTDLYFEHKQELSRRWLSDIHGGDPRAKLAVFWHSHFATEEVVYDCPSFKWSYYNLLYSRCLGNFRAFVTEMGLNPAMLVYLNGNINVVGQPNENYARELMELFTMGEGNGYTQNDIVEVARALTGWRINRYACDITVTFSPSRHDAGSKTIFGQTGNWGYEDVHTLIFTQRRQQVATYICSKIYRYFVNATPDWNVIGQLAQTFTDNDWELAPVFRQILKSAHFFDESQLNHRIKSPVEALIGPFRLLGINQLAPLTEDQLNTINYWLYLSGEELFNPPDVAGWPGQRSWMNENALTSRWNYTASLLYGTIINTPDSREHLRQMAIQLVDGNTEASAEAVVAAIARFLLKRELEEDLFDIAVAYFKGEVPANYFEDGTWNLYYEELPDQLLALFYYLTRLPEWQLA